jgi:7-cyano-7-deazaguanine synthase
MKSDLVLLSGGIDSTVLLHQVRHSHPEGVVYALSFIYNQNHVRELKCAASLCSGLNVQHKTINITSVGQILKSALTGKVEVPTSEQAGDDVQPPTYVPFRNTILLSIAFGVAESLGADEVYYGSQQRDDAGYWDCTDEFVAKFQAVADLNRKHKIKLKRPFRKMEKWEVVKLGSHYNVNFANTYSCYRGGVNHCWDCPTCDERRLAFMNADIKDPLYEETNG